MGTGGRTSCGEEGHFVPGGWREEAEATDMEVAIAGGGGGGNGKICRLMFLTGAVK